MSDVKETAERISTERRQMVKAIMLAMQGHDFGRLDHETGTFTCSMAQIDLLEKCCNDAVDRLLASRHADAQEGGEVDGSDAAAIEIADAVIEWMVRHSLLDADQEYRDDDITAVLDELSPGLATINDEAFASPLAAPSNPVVSDEMVAEFFKAISVSRTGDPHADVRSGLTAALSVSLQSGSDKP